MLDTRFACCISYVAITFLFFNPRLTSQTVPAGCSFYNQPCQSVTAGICQSTDDVFESIPDNQVRNLAFLDVGNSGDRQIGLRYKTVDLPTNAIVKSAQIQFYGAFSSFNNGILDAQIDGEDLTQNSVTFTNMVGTVSNRPRTTANVVWPIPEYRVAANGEVVQTVDLTPIINEFLAEGWTQGDPMTFFLSRLSGLRKAFGAYDTELDNPNVINGSQAPKLTIEYTLPPPPCNDVAGVVYEDSDDSGSFDPSAPDLMEVGIADITVNLYDDAGLVGTTITDGSGNWQFPIAAGDSIRVEYIYPDFYAPAKSSNLLSSTETAFIYAPECCLDFGLHEKKGFQCEEPEIVAICNTRCISTDAPTSPVILSFAESDRGANSTNIADYTSVVNPINITTSRVGSLYGLAYNKSEDVLYAGAYYHNSGTTGPLGTGGLYCVDNSANDGTHQSVNNAMVTDMLSIPNAGVDPTGGTCIQDDPSLMQFANKIGLGDVDLNSTCDTLYTVNLNTMELIAIPVDGCTAGAPVSYAIPQPVGTHTCTGDEIRPHALKYYQGKVYIGAVCTANNSQDRNNLWAYVFEYTEGSGINPAPVLDFPLDYTRQNSNFNNVSGNAAFGNWLPWRDDFTTPAFPDSLVKDDLTQLMYPQPILSDIEFSNGDMSLSFTDRFEHQFSSGTEPSGTFTNIASVPAGDILRAGNNGNDTWTIENNASISGVTSGAITTGGAFTQEGPNGGEFYYQEGFLPHREIVVGGLSQISGSPDVIVATFDPTIDIAEAGGETRFGSGGLNWLNNTSGELDYAWEGYRGSGVNFGKGNGFGDVEHICECPPIEIGNRIWCDLDNDGIQDPEEPPVPAVILNLYDDAGVLVGTTTTDAEGRYYFSNNNVTGDIDPLTNYFIALDASNFDANGNLNINGSFFGVLTDNDISTIGELDDNDSDALVPSDILSGLPVIDGVGVPYIPVSTGDFGCNDFSFDFGFFHCPVESCFSIVISRN